MARSSLFFASVVGVLLLSCVAVPAIATNVTYTGQKITITQPGTYTLTNDIRDSTQTICIEIQTSNVVFDGAGHLIDGQDTVHTAGIYVHGPSVAVSGVTIRNVRMQDWYYGVYLHDADNSKVLASAITSNDYCGIVAYKNAIGNAITGNTVTGNQYGMVFSDGAANAVVSGNQITQNDLGLYVYLSDGITVTRNRILNNINSGIQFHTSGGGRIYDNNLNNNLNVAFTSLTRESVRANEWSTTPGANWSPANIINGPRVGGNYWCRPDGTGFSQTSTDANRDGFIDVPFTIAEGNVDAYPLASCCYGTPLYSGSGSFWLEQTGPAEEGGEGVATLYMESTWSPQPVDILLNLSWDGENIRYAGTDWKVDGTVSAEPSGPSGLSLRMATGQGYASGLRPIAEISFTGLKAGSSPLYVAVGHVFGYSSFHGTVFLGSAGAREGVFVVSATTATPTPPGGPSCVVVPGGAGLPTDPDDDGTYEDVDGDGTVSFADLVLFFGEAEWIGANEPTGCFDFNDNGRIDLGDVVWLFNHLDAVSA